MIAHVDGEVETKSEGDDDQMTPPEKRGNDENQQIPLKDPFHVPVGTITRSKIQEDQRST
jgi:hypothetical protein